MRTNEHNPMDELLRRYVEEAPVPFKDEYWEKMSAALDEEDKGSKKPFLWRGLSILAIVLTLGLGAYILPKLNSSKNAHETQHAVKPIQGSLASVQQDAGDASTPSNSNNESTTNTAPNVNSENSTTQTSSAITSNDETEIGIHAAPRSAATTPTTINPSTTDIKNEQKSIRNGDTDKRHFDAFQCNHVGLTRKILAHHHLLKKTNNKWVIINQNNK